MNNKLPIDDVLSELIDALNRSSCVVLVAPPGAGKTTRVPLAIRHEPWVKEQKILVLSPRRLAARAAAERMADILGECVGETVGYRVRLDTKIGPKTKIEIITEGVFTRFIQDHPDLPGVAAILFDEFHERSLDADLGLALAVQSQSILRPDLRLVPMSATLDAARIANLLGDAPIVQSEGRSYPIDTHYLGRDSALSMEDQVVRAIQKALREETGSILVFLPGAREIHRVFDKLQTLRLPAAFEVHALYGALEASVQRAAIAPASAGKRKIVLATSIAETSLTIDGIRVVIDAGLARRPLYEPGVGLTRLVTERASQAAVEQRRGRAGRIEPGVCYRLWEEGQTRALALFDPPQILDADLTGLALDLAIWGVKDPAELTWLDLPPAGAYAEASALLKKLGALDEHGNATEHARTLARLPLPPRLSHMVVMAQQHGMGNLAVHVAVLLSEQGLGSRDSDLRHRLIQWEQDRSPRARQARSLAGRWREMIQARAEALDPEDVGVVLAWAYPDRVALARTEVRGQYLLANGRAAQLDDTDPLANETVLVVADLAGAADRSRILLAAPLQVQDLDTLFKNQHEEELEIKFDADRGLIRARQITRLGKLALKESNVGQLSPSQLREAWKIALQRHGIGILPWTTAQERIRTRVAYLRDVVGAEWPDLTQEGLMVHFDDGLGTVLEDKMRLADINSTDLDMVLDLLVPWNMRKVLEELAPDRLATPARTSHAIDYTAPGGPSITVRVQEVFGLNTHPTLIKGRVPISLILLSPGHRPIQTTQDLPGFWKGSWAAVKTEMKGRYPKHPWPDDPASAQATTRAKPRGS